MHDRVLQMVRDGRLAAMRPRAVLVLLVWAADHPHRAAPSWERVQKLAGCSKRNVARAVQELRAAGITDALSPAGPRRTKVPTMAPKASAAQRSTIHGACERRA